MGKENGRETRRWRGGGREGRRKLVPKLETFIFFNEPFAPSRLEVNFSNFR